MAENMDAVVENMQKVRAAQQGGVAFESLLSGEPEVVPQALPPVSAAEVAYTISGEGALVALREAELAPVSEPAGMSVRGWSPEVTARDPRLVAEAMAELIGEDDAAEAAPFDPLDAGALALAQRDAGFADVVANNLRVEAIRLVGRRLVEAIDKAGVSSPLIAAARAQAAEAAQIALPDGDASGSRSTSGSKDRSRSRSTERPKERSTERSTERPVPASTPAPPPTSASRTPGSTGD